MTKSKTMKTATQSAVDTLVASTIANLPAETAQALSTVPAVATTVAPVAALPATQALPADIAEQLAELAAMKAAAAKQQAKIEAENNATIAAFSVSDNDNRATAPISPTSFSVSLPNNPDSRTETGNGAVVATSQPVAPIMSETFQTQASTSPLLVFSDPSLQMSEIDLLKAQLAEQAKQVASLINANAALAAKANDSAKAGHSKPVVNFALSGKLRADTRSIATDKAPSRIITQKHPTYMSYERVSDTLDLAIDRQSIDVEITLPTLVLTPTGIRTKLIERFGVKSVTTDLNFHEDPMRLQALFDFCKSVLGLDLSKAEQLRDSLTDSQILGAKGKQVKDDVKEAKLPPTRQAYENRQTAASPVVTLSVASKSAFRALTQDQQRALGFTQERYNALPE